MRVIMRYTLWTKDVMPIKMLKLLEKFAAQAELKEMIAFEK